MATAASERVAVSVPANNPGSAIAGSVLPLKAAESLIQTLPGVVAVRIVADERGSVGEVHVLTTPELTPKQTVRNIESALMAQLGMKVDHRKVSVATSSGEVRAVPAESVGGSKDAAEGRTDAMARRIYFEDVEVRRSRSRGVSCRVTLKKGEASFVGESEGPETERSRLELAAQAAVKAIVLAEGEVEAEGAARALAVSGCRQVEAFERQFVFAGVTAKWGRESVLLTGSCEIKDSMETAAVLAVLDATNRWMAHEK